MQTPEAEREPPGADSAVRSLAEELTRDFPNVHQMASNYIKGEIKSRTGIDVDPDKTYLHRFGSDGKYDGQAFTGFRHAGVPRRSLTLTETVLSNHFGKLNADHSYVLDGQAGVYSEGPSARNFGAHNEVKILPTTIRDIVWKSDFSTMAQRRFEDFWDKNLDRYRAAVKGSYLVSTVKQHDGKQLSDEGFQLAVDAAGMRSQDAANPSLADLQAAAPPRDPAIKISPLDIDGSTATDILQIERGGKKLLYVPGFEPPFHEFSNLPERYDWLRAQAGNDQRRSQLASHFSPSDGVDSSLKQLRDGTLSPLAINFAPSALGGAEVYRIKGDPFAYVAAAQKQRSLAHADTVTTSNWERIRDDALDIATTATGILAPIAVQSPPLRLIMAGLTAARLALATEKAVEGDTAEDRGDGRIQAAWAALDALTNFGVPKIGGDTAGAGSVAKEAEPGAPFFKPPRRVNGQIGYLSSPIDPPRLPEEPPVEGSGHWEHRRPSSEDIEQRLRLTESEAPVERPSGQDHPTGAGTADGRANARATINSKGLIEHTDFPILYRVDASPPDEIAVDGFFPSTDFQGVPPMLDGAPLITSETRAGADKVVSSLYSDSDRGHYYLYAFDADGLKAVSLLDNQRYEPIQLGRLLRRESVAGLRPIDLAEGAGEFAETHVESNVPVERIRLLETNDPHLQPRLQQALRNRAGQGKEGVPVTDFLPGGRA
ncbi:dermonecrotic toxin domain-containing protein [Trinickia mobilis]|uniref:dermonecrotic toxin domain-containing protein n=1 Tax=Trinickia mobilis TaxID=2816356 RepID=UPI001A8CE270|nr:DUF6543 domain-containing protein [Trinickia mobilis]